MKSILVTGIGGTRSLAVAKALRQGKNRYRVIGSDANYFNAGAFQCDAAYTVPLATSDEYLPRLEEIIEKEDIGLIFATVEKEVAVLAKLKKHLSDKFGVAAVVPDPAILEVCFDKARTQQFLTEHDFTAIPTIYASEEAEVESFARTHRFPLIRKPVFGYGSRGLSLVNNLAELEGMPLEKEYVLQKYIANDETESFYNLELNEYTAEIFIYETGQVAGGIILKRALRNGETIAGYLVKDEAIRAYLEKVARATGIHGPVNFQFRIHQNEVYIFEINPLYSGTTAVRATLGFNSVELATESLLYQRYPVIKQDDLKEQYFLRQFEEVFINPDALRTLKETGELRHG